ncbi:MAG TPA: hypothetical protein VI942_08115, partial [Thermoanaerobaculia bacterium]|nr:hypothetical protein [Thermoanaerobaculia bacterium]
MPDRSSLFATLITAGALLVPAAATAQHLPSPREVHREVRSHVHDALRQLRYVPQRIHRDHRSHLDVFLGGRNYYGPHRHYHSTYRFPVWVGGSVAYRPYDYCGDALFGSPGVRLQLWSDWGRDRHATWCDDCRSYYPSGSRHSCGYGYRAPAYRYDYGSPHLGYPGRRDHRYDHDDRYDRDHRYDRDYR